MMAGMRLTPVLLPMWLAICLLWSCDSTALSLGDPNELNADLDPPFIDESGTTAVWTLTLLGATEDAGVGDMSDNYIISADFGEGVGLSGTGYTFTSNFVIELGLTRFAEAEPGARTFNVRFVNDYGEFFAHGEFTVY